MGIDLKKMKEKLGRLQNGGRSGGKSNFWRPQDGEQTIRIVPTADGDPFKEYWFHYNLGQNAGFLSPKKNFGEEDPLNDFIRSLYQEGTEDSIKMAKSLNARQRFFAPVIVRGEENAGVRVCVRLQRQAAPHDHWWGLSRGSDQGDHGVSDKC